jgi:hypothetical protein
LHPTGIEGANQTIFVRRIALPLSLGFFGEPGFAPSVDDRTPLERFRDAAATLGGIKQDWRVVEKPENTQSLPAAKSGASRSADIEEGSDSEDAAHAQDMFCSLAIHVCR